MTDDRRKRVPGWPWQADLTPAADLDLARRRMKEMQA
jgi:hypothetical protein